MYYGIKPWEIDDLTPGEFEAIERHLAEMGKAAKGSSRK
jgi:hypothetical protein